MIKFLNTSQTSPYLKFKQKYDAAFGMNQKNIEAISISSYSTDLKEVNSRFVNLKIIDDENFIFFSNYNSPKSIEFQSHNQISAVLYWESSSVQIRMRALINRTSVEYNKKYFSQRSSKKNALAISSNQSKIIDSYASVRKKYNKSLESDNLDECPDFWGGYEFKPYYFEFWEGHDLRLNKREAYEKNGNDWHKSFLQP
jgi:pyridoxamine 5'-phosphate oxidase